ncbi:hypothetical protein JXA80_10095 [bacterium]|nr:hypothetical protein [candidate division CSSED10-310 bacterium]
MSGREPDRKGKNHRKNGVLMMDVGAFLDAGKGGIIGFLAAAVLYSRYLPPWVPSCLARSPRLFFGLLILICTTLGYIWGITPDPEPETPDTTGRRRSFSWNRVFTGLFSGFLVAAVLYQKYMPTWVPVFFTEYPAVFFVLFTLTGGIIGWLWSRTESLQV